VSENQDWQGVLGIADPAPGDPSSIRGLSDAYSTVAANASQANNLLAQVQAAGTGQAMTAFNSHLAALPGHIQTLHSSYQEAASALGAYAPALSAAQDQANQAWAQAGPAHADLQAAQQQVAHWQAQLNQVPATDAAGQVQASANLEGAQGDQDRAQAQLDAARALAQQASEARVAAGRTAATALDHAASHSIPARSVWQQISDWFGDNPWFGWVLAALAVILPFLGPIGIALGLLAGGVLLASQILSMALTGKWNVTDLVLGILSLIPGLAELSGLKLGAKLGAAIGDIAKSIPGADRLVGASGDAAAGLGEGAAGLGGDATEMLGTNGPIGDALSSIAASARQGLRDIISRIRPGQTFTTTRGAIVKAEDIVSRPIVTGDGEVIGGSLMSEADWAARQDYWQNFDRSGTTFQARVDNHQLGLVSTDRWYLPRAAPWKSGKVLFIETHGDGGAIFTAETQAGTAGFDGTQFGQVLKSQRWFRTLLKDNPDAAIYVNACGSGRFPDTIGQQLAQELGRTVYAPTTSTINPVTVAGTRYGHGNTLITAYGDSVGNVGPIGGDIRPFHPAGPVPQLPPLDVGNPFGAGF
jgi:hypothetical protein